MAGATAAPAKGCGRGPAAEAGEEGKCHRGAGEQRAGGARSWAGGASVLLLRPHGWADQGGEDGLLGAEAGDRTLLQDQDLVGLLQQLRPVGDDDDRHAVLLQAVDDAMSAASPCPSRFALGSSRTRRRGLP